jgi:hypothetical protein
MFIGQEITPIGIMSLDRALFLFMALGSLQWITLANIGLSIKPVHLPLFYMAISGFMRANFRLLGRGWTNLFVVSYALYLVWLLVSAIWSSNVVAGILLTFRSGVYFVLAVGMYLYLARISHDRVMKSLLYGGLASVLVFSVVATVTLQMRGVSVASLIGLAISTGDPNFLQFQLFYALFNPPGAAGTDEALKVAVRHAALGFPFIGLMAGMYHVLACRYQKIAWITILSAFLLILLSLSRSLILTTLLGLFIASWGIMRRRPYVTLIVAFVIPFSAVTLALVADLSGVENIIEERFGNFGEDARAQQFSSILDVINQNVFLGRGAGELVAFGGKEAIIPHNLFLAGWTQAGIPGLAFSLAAWLVLLAMFVSPMNGKRAELVAISALLVLPIFRSQVGAGGNFTLPEWVCVVVALRVLPSPRFSLAMR